MLEVSVFLISSYALGHSKQDKADSTGAKTDTQTDGINQRISTESHRTTRAFTKTPVCAHSQTVLANQDPYV